MSEIDEDEEQVIVFASVLGLRRWDNRAKAEVAAKLRSNSLSRIEREGLANLIEGKHPRGLHLKMAGQGNAVSPLEGYKMLEEALLIEAFVTDFLAKGETWEAAIIEASIQFNISESKVVRARKLAQRGIEIGMVLPTVSTSNS